MCYRHGVISCSYINVQWCSLDHRDLTQSWEENIKLKALDHWDAAFVWVVVDEPLCQPLDRALGPRLVHLAQTPASHEMLRQL